MSYDPDDEVGKPINMDDLFERIDELHDEGLTVSDALTQAWEELTDEIQK